MPDEVKPQTIGEREACIYIGMSVAWLRQGRMRGRGPSYLRIGRSIRYRICDLDAWLEGHLVQTKDQGQRRTTRRRHTSVESWVEKTAREVEESETDDNA